MQMTRKYRKCDLADSEFLENQGDTYFNRGIRKWFHQRPSVHLFPEPASTVPADD
jgi:hypothetical protein